MLKFISFGSGSSGNCYYLGTATDGLLIDIGVGCDRRTTYRYRSRNKDTQEKCERLRSQSRISEKDSYHP